MKKFFLIILCFLVIAPCAMFLVACGEISSYTIEVLASDIRYGLVTGSGTFNEGDSATIKATTKGDETNFLCWTLNNKVVSNQAEYTFNVSKENQGTFIAVFDQGCEYFTITSAVLNIYEDAKPTTLNLKALGGASLSSLQEIYNTTSSPVISTQNKSTITSFYTGNLIHRKNNNNDAYYCKIEAIAISEAGEKTYEKYIDLDFDKLLESGSLETPITTIDNFGTIKLTIAKLDGTLVNEILNISV